MDQDKVNAKAEKLGERLGKMIAIVTKPFYYAAGYIQGRMARRSR